jgi:hypothetical protein
MFGSGPGSVETISLLAGIEVTGGKRFLFGRQFAASDELVGNFYIVHVKWRRQALSYWGRRCHLSVACCCLADFDRSPG